MRNIAASSFAIRKWATVLRIPFMCILQADYHYHEIDSVGRFFVDLEMAEVPPIPLLPICGILPECSRRESGANRVKLESDLVGQESISRRGKCLEQPGFCFPAYL